MIQKMTEDWQNRFPTAGYREESTQKRVGRAETLGDKWTHGTVWGGIERKEKTHPHISIQAWEACIGRLIPIIYF